MNLFFILFFFTFLFIFFISFSHILSRFFMSYVNINQSDAVYRLMADRGRGGSVNKISFRELEDYFFPKSKIIYPAWYGPQSIQFSQSGQFGGGLDIYE